MRQVIWIAGKIPDEMTPEKYLDNLKMLSTAVGAELVKFGETSHLLIGDDKAAAKLKIIQGQADKQK